MDSVEFTSAICGAVVGVGVLVSTTSTGVRVADGIASTGVRVAVVVSCFVGIGIVVVGAAAAVVAGVVVRKVVAFLATKVVAFLATKVVAFLATKVVAFLATIDAIILIRITISAPTRTVPGLPTMYFFMAYKPLPAVVRLPKQRR